MLKIFIFEQNKIFTNVHTFCKGKGSVQFLLYQNKRLSSNIPSKSYSRAADDI